MFVVDDGSESGVLRNDTEMLEIEKEILKAGRKDWSKPMKESSDSRENEVTQIRS